MVDKLEDMSMKEKSESESQLHREINFTPIQAIIINKRMPKGIKIETEENVIKAAESLKPVAKKQKIGHKELGAGKSYDEVKKKRAKKVDYSDVTSKDNSEFSERAKKRSARDKKPVVQEDIGYVEKDKLKGGKNPLLMDIARKCEKAFQKIKKHPLADYFVNPVKPDAPSLSQIEKAIKSLTYTNLYQFGLDLRKLWTFHFSTSTGNGEIFQRTCKMSEFSEEVIKELENAPEEKSDIHELSKKVEKLTKEVKEISFKGGQPTTQNVTKKPEKGGSILDKPMSNAEKNNLGNSIRNLTPDQLKGIVNILSDSLVIDAQSRFFEFDIETLSTRKLRELEKYVKQCLKGKTGQPKTEANVTKKPPVQHPTGEMSENDRVAQLKNDLAFNKNGNVGSRVGTVQTKLQTNSNIGQQQTQHKRPSQNREIKNVLSESDESLSSSDESDSESLSSIDFKKGGAK